MFGHAHQSPAASQRRSSSLFCTRFIFLVFGYYPLTVLPAATLQNSPYFSRLKLFIISLTFSPRGCIQLWHLPKTSETVLNHILHVLRAYRTFKTSFVQNSPFEHTDSKPTLEAHCNTTTTPGAFKHFFFCTLQVFKLLYSLNWFVKLSLLASSDC